MKHLECERYGIPLIIKDVLKRNSLVVAEIGVWAGYYTDVYYSQLHGSKIYLIDLWETQGNDWEFSRNSGMAEDGYKQVINKYQNNPDFTICKGYSTDWAKKFPDSFFDWIYIDADHSYQAVLDDLAAWYPKIKTHGIISGHDFPPYADTDNPHPAHENYPFGVEKAVTEFFKNDLHNLYLTNEKHCKSWMLIKPRKTML